MCAMERLREAADVVWVSAYLAGVGGLLRVTGRLRPFTSAPVLVARAVQRQVGRLLVAGPHAGPLAELRHHEGRAYVGRLPRLLGARSEAEGGTGLDVLEDGVPLRRARDVDEVLAEAGRYYHWFDAVVFSPRDAADPRAGGHRYTYRLHDR